MGEALQQRMCQGLFHPLRLSVCVNAQLRSAPCASGGGLVRITVRAEPNAGSGKQR